MNSKLNTSNPLNPVETIWTTHFNNL
jgi:hypothetical protein